MESNAAFASCEVLQCIREDLVKLDKDLVRLISERYALCMKACVAKIQADLPIRDKNFEKQRLQIVKAYARETGVNEALIEKLLEVIVQESIALQEKFATHNPDRP